jgi:pilus assembly protein FimV
VHRSIIRACLFLFVLTSSYAVHATGLGNLTLNSYLGQPFKAEIDIVSVKQEDIPSLSVKLASRETFQQSNVDYAPFLFTFRISIENRANGQPYVKITSPQRVVEPFLSMLIELNWSSGRLIREYTVLLDPPEDALEPALPAVQVEPVVPSSAKPEPVAAEQPDSIIIENVVSEEEPTVKEVAPEPEKVPEQVTEPEQKTVLAEQPETTYGPVKSGDTLAKIAQKVAHPRVQLNQMLIALHRANPKAFSDNNMNRLKAGPILRIPDASEVATISPDAADKEVKMQTANWEAYRQKLAAEVDSATSSADEESAQTATGKISTMIENLAEAAKKPSEEKLSISKGEGIEGSKSENTTSGAQDKIRALEESAIAKEKTLNEANERVAILEKSVKELQQLLKLKNAEMAVLQNQAEPITPDATTETILPPAITEESSADDEGSAQEDEESSGSVEEVESGTIEAPAAETAEPSPKAVPAPPPIKKALPVVVEDPSMMDSIGPVIDSLMENIEYVGAALLLLLIGVFAINRKKKAAVNDIDLDEGEDEIPSDTEDTPTVTGFGVGKKTKQADDYDPVIEAGQYLDHGRDVQAEKILKDALAKDQSNPGILAKLLEVHTQRKDKSAFETTARKLWSVSPTGPLWEKAAKLGLSIDPENPFYGGVASTTTNIDQVKENEEVPDESSVTTSDSVETPVNTPESSEPVNDEPDFGINFSSSEEDENDSGNVVTMDSPVSDDTKDIDDTSMDFPDVSESEEATPAPVLPEADLADINLNIDDSVPAEPVDTQSVEKSAQWHEIATKIDLARAYQEMGDNDGAKEILQEVLKDGDAEQQESAKAILESL